MSNLEVLVFFILVAVVSALPAPAGGKFSKRGTKMVAICAAVLSVGSIIYWLFMCFMSPTLLGKPLSEYPVDVQRQANQLLWLYQVTILGAGVGTGFLSAMFWRQAVRAPSQQPTAPRAGE